MHSGHIDQCSFDLAGSANRRDWLRAGIGLEDKLGDGTGPLVVKVATRGEMPNVWPAANRQMAF